VEFGGVPIRRDLLWEAHLRRPPKWLKPYLQVPDDAAPPLIMTPVHPEATGSYGPKAIEWVESHLGITLRWWQQLAVVRQLEHRRDKSLCWGDVTESATRRSGKSVRLRSMALWRLDVGPSLFHEPQLAIHTGKDLAIVREIQRGAWHWAESQGWRVVRAIGRESIENGDHRWLARATDSVYGYDTTLGYVDEGWAVDPETVSEGMEPAVLERISPQIVLTSTAHRRATSLMPTRIKDGMAVNDTLLMLWSVLDEMLTGDVATWRAASAHWSPARQRLMQQKYDKALRGEIDPELDDPDPVRGFEMQYLNRWLLKRGAGGPLAGWDDLATERVPPRPEVLGVASDQSESWFSLGAYGEGFVAPVYRQRVELGRANFIAHVARKAAGGVPVSVREKGQAGVLIRDLEDAGVYVIPASADDLVQASSDFADAVETGMVVHGAMQELDDAVFASRWRNVGDRRVLDVRGTDVSMLEAVILARLIAVGEAAPMPAIYGRK
jgi:hypothetical protein